ncbi:MAG: family 10 glycosylhydrolase [Gemmatimonadota bacterium]
MGEDAAAVGPQRRRRWPYALAGLAALCLSSCAFLLTHQPPASPLPAPEREFRGVWVATVDNIDWPSKPGLPAEQQQAEARAILDRCVQLRLNAVVLQVRPQCDALYASDLEPWSAYLTGRQGQPPRPLYDPLRFWVEEAHARGLELHAWFNPYRANHPRHVGELAPESMVRRRPDLALKLGDEGYYWLDPGHPDTRAHTLRVILDVVRRYDVDGVHLDDYFYPYPSYNKGQDFPDSATWQAYLDRGGKLSRQDWRRRNVDLFVEELYRQVKQSKRWVKVGISPFGIWRPNSPPSIETSFDQYDMIFADARLWLERGWLDYCAPQLYWPVAQVPQSYPVLLAWWTRHNLQGRHLWPGLYTSRVGPEGWPAREIANQVMVERALVPGAPGHIHFSARALLDDRSGSDGAALAPVLEQGPYRRRALVPASPWLDHTPPPAPVAAAHARTGEVTVSWKPADGEGPAAYLVYSERGGSWQYEVVPGGQRTWRLPVGTAPGAATPPAATDRVTRVAVAAVDRGGNVGPAALLEVGAGR